MKKITFYLTLIIIVFTSMSTTVFAPCAENDPDYDGIRSWVFFQEDLDHPSNCSYAGNGCASCTAPGND